MITINASKGLGDAIYLRAVVLHMLERGQKLTVYTGWPDVFRDLPVLIKGLSDVTGDEDWHHAKPCLHCRMSEMRNMDVFRMACRQAGIDEPVELRMQWQQKNVALVDRIRTAAAGRKIFIYQPHKKVFNRNQALVRPARQAFADYISRASEYFRVRVGHPAFLDEDYGGSELDLFGRISVTDLFDIGSISDVVFSEPSALTAMAQAMGKTTVCMFSREGLESGRNYVGNVKPERIFPRPEIAEAVYG